MKVGQQSVDQEFMVSQNAATFMNATFGWPVLPSTDLPAGGPAYPLSSLGVRLRVKPSDAWTAMVGVFDGNPAGRSDGDAQVLNAHGTNFNLRSGAFVIGEVQYALNAPPADPKAPQPAGLPGTYKLGFWYQSQHANDPRYGTDGLSLANPASNGIAATHRGNYGFYAVADQMVWRPSADSPRSVGVFARVMGAPGDRNIVDFAANAGVTLKAPFKDATTTSRASRSATRRSARMRAASTATRASTRRPAIRCAARRRSSKRRTSTRSRRGGSCRPTCSTSSVRAAASRTRTRPVRASATKRWSAYARRSRSKAGLKTRAGRPLARQSGPCVFLRCQRARARVTRRTARAVSA